MAKEVSSKKRARSKSRTTTTRKSSNFLIKSILEKYNMLAQQQQFNSTIHARCFITSVKINNRRFIAIIDSNAINRPARRTACTRCRLRTCWYCLLASSIQHSQMSSPSSHQERERRGRCRRLERQIAFFTLDRNNNSNNGNTSIHSDYRVW